MADVGKTNAQVSGRQALIQESGITIVILPISNCFCLAASMPSNATRATDSRLVVNYFRGISIFIDPDM